MDVFIICLAAFAGSALTFFSGFGLGTLLLPVFGLFFPIEIAVGLTAIVHFLNNLFKLGNVWRYAQWRIVWQFGLPALLAAAAGAWLLSQLPHFSIYQYRLGGRLVSVSLLKLVVGSLMLFFAIVELSPRWQHASVPVRWLPLGGLLSGFFGGLSGHQGALRSTFLLRLQLPKAGFVATGVAIACLVDISRLSLYSSIWITAAIPWKLVAAATGSAFGGAWLGNRWLKKSTLRGFQIAVAVFIIAFSLALMAGLI